MYRKGHKDVTTMFDGIFVDMFAGGGGASTGIESALGVAVDVAINHDWEAVAMHQVNHPNTVHLTCDVWEADPVEVAADRWIKGMWLSPDCTHHSKARGGKPIREPGKKSRALAWVVMRWAKLPVWQRPRVIYLENVEEFRDWGPLDENNNPCPKRKGSTFQRWVSQLRNLGYEVDWRELRACDYGAPTIRKRLFVIARCDGQPIAWPQQTHFNPKGISNEHERRTHLRAQRLSEDGAQPFARDADAANVSTTQSEAATRRSKRAVPVREWQEVQALPSRSARLKPYRTAADCIDFNRRCPSIFNRKKRLKPKTEARIANGIRRFVIEHPKPFIVRCAHGDHCNGTSRWGKAEHSISEPLPTVTASKDFAIVQPFIAHVTHDGERRAHQATEPMPTVTGAHRGELALVAPLVTKFRGDSPGSPIDQPLPTITSGGQCERPAGAAHAMGLVAPYLIPRYGEREGQAPRCRSVREPMATIVPKSNGGDLVSGILMGAGGPSYAAKPRPVDAPMGTVMTENHHGLATAHLAQFNTNPDGSLNPGHDVREPLSTIATKGPHQGLVSGALIGVGGRAGQSPPRSIDSPMGTTTAKADAAVAIVKLRGTSKHGQPVSESLHTVTGGGTHLTLISAVFLCAYFGNDKDGQSLNEPMRTVTTKDRFALMNVVLGTHDAAGIKRVGRFMARHDGAGDVYAIQPRNATELRNKLKACKRRRREKPLRLSWMVIGRRAYPAVTVWVDRQALPMVDIGMRMLVPRELYLAQGFPPTYVIDPMVPNKRGKLRRLPIHAQVRMCGNSVSPPPAEAIVRANSRTELVPEELAA